MTIVKVLICIVIGYLFGSLSGSIITSRLMYDADIREKGSGNAGLTNSLRIYGAAGGVATALIDILKTTAAIGIAKLLLPDLGIMAAGAGVVLGHMFPVYFKFKGGKGAVCVTIIGLFIDYRMVLCAFAVFASVLLITGIMSAATISGMISASISAYFFGVETGMLIFICVFCAFVIFMHRSNIKRIINGTEKRIIRKGGSKE